MNELDFDNENELLREQFKRIMKEHGSMSYAGGNGCLYVNLEDGKYKCQHHRWQVIQSKIETESHERAFDWLIRRIPEIDIHGDAFEND